MTDKPLHPIIQRWHDAGISTTYGSQGIGDIVLLARYAMQSPVIVELGVWRGTTSALLKFCNQAVVYAVDVYGQFDLIADKQQREHYKKLWEENKQFDPLLVRYQLDEYGIITIQQETWRAASRFQDNSVDMIFIDADHSYKGVEADFTAWQYKLKRGGWFLLHDVNDDHPGVKKFVTEAVICNTAFVEEPHTLPLTSIRVFRRRA